MSTELERLITQKKWDILMDNDFQQKIDTNISLPIIAKKIKDPAFTVEDKCNIIMFGNSLKVKELKHILLIGLDDTSCSVISYCASYLYENNFDLANDLTPAQIVHKINTVSSKEFNSSAVRELVLLLARVGTIKDLNIVSEFILKREWEDKDYITEAIFWAKAYLHEKETVKSVIEQLTDTNQRSCQYVLEWLPYLNDTLYTPYLIKLLDDDRPYLSTNEAEYRFVSDKVVTCLSKFDRDFAKCVPIEYNDEKSYLLDEMIKVKKYYGLPISHN